MLRVSQCLVLLVIFLAAGVSCSAADAQVFDLTWQASGSGCSFNIKPDVKEPFAKEPDLAGREVVRGLLPCAQDRTQCVAYIWDIDQQRLYVDRNHNRDLTDDPDGVYESLRQNAKYQTFRDVKIEVTRESLPYVYFFSIDFNRYNPQRLYCHLSVQSGFQAQIDLAGQAYRVQLADNLDGKLDRSDRLHISVVKPGPRVPTAHLSMPEKLFLGGRLYDCAYTWAPDTKRPQARLTLTECEASLGQLAIAGQGMDYLELQAEHVVPIFEPNQATLSVPAGDYSCAVLHLQRQGRQHMYVQNLNQRVLVKAGELATLKIGGPLKSTVSVERTNRSLELNFKIVGQGGEEYRSAGAHGAEPRFKIYRGDKEIHSGQFEYG